MLLHPASEPTSGHYIQDLRVRQQVRSQLLQVVSVLIDKLRAKLSLSFNTELAQRFLDLFQLVIADV